MKIEAYACELMRLLGKNRLLKPWDQTTRDRRDTQALVSLLRRQPAAPINC